MFRYYLSDNFFFDIKSKQHFKELDDDTIIDVNNNNFIEIFGDYGWIGLDDMWDIELGFDWLMMDCGSNGDCLFHSISEALNLNLIYNLDNNDDTALDLFDIISLREIVGNEINDSNFHLILESYKLEKDMDEFQGEWDPYKIENTEQLKDEINKCGDNFWGDHIILQLLSKALNLNFIVLNDYNMTGSLTYNTILNDPKFPYMILYFEIGSHYKLVGQYSNNKMNILFDCEPKELIDLRSQII